MLSAISYLKVSIHWKMEDKTNFHWMYCKKNVESQCHLEDILPCGFSTSSRVIKEANVLCESKLKSKFPVNLCGEDNLNDFFEKFCKISKTEHNISWYYYLVVGSALIMSVIRMSKQIAGADLTQTVLPVSSSVSQKLLTMSMTMIGTCSRYK